MKKGYVRAAAIQPTPNYTSNQKAVAEILMLADEAVKRKAEVICLPELWLPEEPVRGFKVFKPLVEFASKHEVSVITGANYELLSNKLYISSLVIGKHGKILGRQAKTHPFGEEKTKVAASPHYEVFDVGDCVVGVMVCYDAVFPEAARILALKGADIIFCPARILGGGVEPWHLYLKVRALENRVPVVGVNIAKPPRFLGRSIIVGLTQQPGTNIVYPKVLAEAGGKQQIIVGELNIGLAKKLRKERFADRKPESYSPIRMSSI